MNNRTLILSAFILFSSFTYSQQPVDVTDQTFKIGSLKTEGLYFGFAAGDQVIFNFSEASGKELKEVEVIEYPNTSKFSDYKSAKIENKIFQVSRAGVYKFRFYNNALAGRVCKLKIQRIPSSEDSRNYNTNVVWMDKQDTTWNSYTKDVIIGYDTTYEMKTEKVLLNTEVREDLLMDKIQRVHSTTNDNGPRTWVHFTLPRNEVTAYQTKTVKAWAYWVGVDEEGNNAWKQNVQALGSLAKKAATYYTTPLGALAVGAVADLMVPTLGEDVYYAVTMQAGKEYFMAGQSFRVYDQGKGVGGYKKFTDPGMCQGTFFICMSNDNLVQGIDASVKVIAIVETNTYEDIQRTNNYSKV